MLLVLVVRKGLRRTVSDIIGLSLKIIVSLIGWSYLPILRHCGLAHPSMAIDWRQDMIDVLSCLVGRKDVWTLRRSRCIGAHQSLPLHPYWTSRQKWTIHCSELTRHDR